MSDVANDRPQTEQRSVSQKLSDEASLLWGAKDWIPTGIKNGFKDMYEHPVHAAEVFGISVAAGLMSTNPYGRAALYGLSALGVTAMLAPDVYSVWQDKNTLPYAQEDLGNKVGT